jgi:protein-tyrosine-phosphatase|tara:strand:+ start:4536 stop:4979 length:444 start_codon:yes stop_codon:yes gene_type:complete
MRIKSTDNILVVCSGNINRSAIAEYLFRAEGFTSVDSCGLGKTAAKSLPMAKKMRALFEEEFNHTSKQINQELVDWADVVLCMGPGQVRKTNKLFNTDKAELFGGKKVDDPHFTNNHKEVADYIDVVIKRYKLSGDVQMVDNIDDFI